MKIINKTELSKRGQEWQKFANKVLQHIEAYTIAQYGDMPDDLASSYTIDDLRMHLKKYATRQGHNVRGAHEDQIDLLKIAHVAAMVFMKSEAIVNEHQEV